MSDRSKQIEALRQVFKQARHASRYKDGAILDLDLHGELQDALIDVRKEGFYELKDEVYPYLQDVFWEYREDAIRTLGGPNGLHLPEFKEVVYKIWLEDPNEYVKKAALGAWAEYYDDTKDPIVLKNLYNIIKSDKYTIGIRVWALYGFMEVADTFDYPREKSEILDLDELEDNQELTKAIDWVKIDRIMCKYVPGWKK